MHTEIEAKFLNVRHGALRTKLRALGARCDQPMRLMRRKAYDFPGGTLDKQDAWVRVRDEGDKTTLSYKQQVSRDLHGTREIELTVSDFGAADELLRAVGLVPKSYYETKRESWALGAVHIDLDEWPWIRPYVEIEGPSAAAVAEAAAQLGFTLDDATYGAAQPYIAEYDVTADEVNSWPSITFTPIPDWLVQRRRA